MHKGFFSLFIAIMGLLLALSLLEQKIAIEKQNAFVVNRALENEQAFFRRTEIENNFDFLAQQTLQKELLAKNFDPQKIRKKVAQNIEDFARRYAKKNGSEFFIEKNGQRTPVNTLELESALQAIVVHKKPFVVAQLFFTGGEKKNIFFKSEIRQGNFSLEFMVPHGYNVTASVIVP